MGFFDKMKDLVGIEEVDDDEITEEEIQAAANKIERKTVDSKKNYVQNKESNVMPMKRATVTDKTGTFKMVIIEPKNFDECPKLVDNLKGRKPVIINLEKVEPDMGRKIFDFLSGATYALNGNVQKIANNIFVFAPENVDISASVDHKGIDFGGNNKSIWR
ncbi:MAG: cell division protein SepF [Eubacteriales bacterium]|nr:cell division protein SepF [Eubacteriales bacterium]MDD4389307.1 cell division protein SepF [Eubacteriales bacterium]